MEFMRAMCEQLNKMDDYLDDSPRGVRRTPVVKRTPAPKPPVATKTATAQAAPDGMSGCETGAPETAGGDDDGSGGDDGGDPDPERSAGIDAWGNTLPGIDEQIIRLDESEATWVDELWNAAEHQTQIQIALVRCPSKDRGLIRCMMSGIPSGRDAKTEKKAVRRVRAAIRGTTCRPRTLSIDIAGLLSEPAQALEHSRRGRPKGSKNKKERSVQLEMFGGAE
ncbi:MAG: hypothetical protein ACYDHY_14915 [Acidiferrobacterales bacterium]